MKDALRERFSWKRITNLFLIVLIAGLYSCSSSQKLSKTEYEAIATASRKLGMKIDKTDNLKLMITASQWIGVPYRSGGKTKRGTDCSGLSAGIYRDAFNIKLSPNSQMQLDKDVKKKIKKNDIQQGDLVFFSAKKSKKKINHVGVYLKDGKFIHASSSKGVRIDRLKDNYWIDKWMSSGRILDLK